MKKGDLLDVELPRHTRSFRPHIRRRVALDCGGPEASRTRQSFADECNINLIMRRYEKSGELPHLRKGPARYGDFVGVPDFMTSLAALRAAETSFMKLPARVRAEFDNDPRKFVAYCENPDSLERLRDLGLADVPPPPPAPVAVQVIEAAGAPKPVQGAPKAD